MTVPYLRICAETREAAEAERRRRTQRANRVLLACIVGAVFFAICLCVGLAARGDSGVWRLPVDRVDAVQIDHQYDGEGKPTFCQVCYADFYEWLPEPRYLYRAWRLAKHPSIIPIRDLQRGGYTAIWMDGDQLRVVRCLSRFESWTNEGDPEIMQRAIHPMDNRRELFRVWK